jgi:hypothetical protein
MPGLLYPLTLIAAVGCGLVAGVFFAFSSFVMNALARLQPAQGVAAMQAINLAAINLADPYELLLGRGTYEIFAAHWPYDEGPIADHLNNTRKHVASTTLDRVEWNNSTLIAGDLADYLEARKREHGPRFRSTGAPA